MITSVSRPGIARCEISTYTRLSVCTHVGVLRWCIADRTSRGSTLERGIDGSAIECRWFLSLRTFASLASFHASLWNGNGERVAWVNDRVDFSPWKMLANGYNCEGWCFRSLVLCSTPSNSIHFSFHSFAQQPLVWKCTVRIAELFLLSGLLAVAKI